MPRILSAGARAVGDRSGEASRCYGPPRLVEPDHPSDLGHRLKRQLTGDGQATLAYLARYVFKVAISGQRIVSIDDQAVTFRYRKLHSNRARTMTLPIAEFMRRFLQHVTLPTGFVKVRSL